MADTTDRETLIFLKRYMNKERHPYIVDPTGLFNLEAIPISGIENSIEFFYNYKRSSENLYIGKISVEHLMLSDSSAFTPYIENYFQNSLFEKGNVTEFNEILFPKICWLTDSFYKKNFRYPISVHYNPRIQQNVIHPGTTRSWIIKLFQSEPEVNCLYFNTGGAEFDFMNSLELVTKDFILKHKDIMGIDLVGDHASIIPHINFDLKNVNRNIDKWQEFVCRRLQSPAFTIKSNKPIKLLQPWTSVDSNIEIEIESTSNTDDICRCLILSILGKSYKSDSLKITHKIQFETPSDTTTFD